MGYQTYHEALDEAQVEQEGISQPIKLFVGAYIECENGQRGGPLFKQPNGQFTLGMQFVTWDEDGKTDGLSAGQGYTVKQIIQGPPLAEFKQEVTPCPTPGDNDLLLVGDKWYLPISDKIAAAIKRPEVNLTEAECFMIEAAYQIADIEWIDDDARTYVVTDEQIVKLMTTVRDTTKEQMRNTYIFTPEPVDQAAQEKIATAMKKAERQPFIVPNSMILSETEAAAIHQMRAGFNGEWVKKAVTALGRDDKALETFKVNEYIDDEIATLMARLDGIPAWKERAFIEREVGEFAREVALRIIMDKGTLITNLANHVHNANVEKGWWSNLKTGEDLHGKRNVGELLALMHSEVSEAKQAQKYDGLTGLFSRIIGVCTLAIVDIDNNKSALLDIHDALSHALEAWRKSKPDDKLPHRPGFRVELVDALIRILDTLGSEQNNPDEHPAGVLFMEKTGYNAVRADHLPENRLKADGKKI